MNGISFGNQGGGRVYSLAGVGSILISEEALIEVEIRSEQEALLEVLQTRLGSMANHTVLQANRGSTSSGDSTGFGGGASGGNNRNNNQGNGGGNGGGTRTVNGFDTTINADKQGRHIVDPDNYE